MKTEPSTLPPSLTTWSDVHPYGPDYDIRIPDRAQKRLSLPYTWGLLMDCYVKGVPVETFNAEDGSPFVQLTADRQVIGASAEAAEFYSWLQFMIDLVQSYMPSNDANTNAPQAEDLAPHEEGQTWGDLDETGSSEVPVVDLDESTPQETQEAPADPDQSDSRRNGTWPRRRRR